MTKRDHRILLISPMVPAEAGNGLAMRCGVFLDALNQAGHVDLLVAPISGYRDAPAITYARQMCDRFMLVETTDRRDTLLEMILRTSDEEERLNMFARYGRPTVCGHLSTTVLREACELIAGQSYDMTVMVRNHNGPLLVSARRKTGTGRCLIDLDDDDGALHRQLAANHRARGNKIQAKWNELEATAFDRLTVENAKLADVTSVSNPLQALHLSQRTGITRPVVIPNSIAMRKTCSPDPDRDPTMLIVGTLNYEPNIDAITWFFNTVFPAIRNEVPRTRLIVAGRRPPANIVQMGSHNAVTVVENPPDVATLYRSATLAVIPLLHGSGTRIKALEAAAFGLPLVSTEIGVDGLGLRDGEHAWITAADPDAFAAACIEALNSAESRKNRAIRLRKHVSQRYERGIVTRQIASFALEQLQTR